MVGVAPTAAVLPPPEAASAIVVPQPQSTPETTHLRDKEDEEAVGSGSVDDAPRGNSNINSSPCGPSTQQSTAAIAPQQAVAPPAQDRTCDRSALEGPSFKPKPPPPSSLPTKKRKGPAADTAANVAPSQSGEQPQSSDAGCGTSRGALKTTTATTTASASWTSKASHLPCKKRKASHDTSTSSFPPAHQQQRRGSQSDAASNSATEDATATVGSGPVSGPLHLHPPSGPVIVPQRKGSQDSTSLAVSFEDDVLRERKGSQDSSLSFDWAGLAATTTMTAAVGARKSSDATPTSLRPDDDLLLLRATLSPGELLSSKPEAIDILPLLPNALPLPGPGAALDHLDALGPAGPIAPDGTGPLPSAKSDHLDPTAPHSRDSATTAPNGGRKTSDADNHSYGSGGTLASSGQRLLLEAMLMAPGPASSQGGSQGPKSVAATASLNNSTSNVNVAGASSSSAAHATAVATAAAAAASAAATLGSGGHPVGLAARERFESWGGLPLQAAARERLESWGAMSDLSLPHASATLDDDGRHGISLKPAPAGGGTVPSRISLQRDRLNSVASLSEVSVNLPILFEVGSLEGLGPSGGASVGSGIVLNASDLQAYVAAAVASVGDQLVELAEAVEHAASGSDDVMGLLKRGTESETSSVASPLIGAAVADSGTYSGRNGGHRSGGSRVNAGASGGRPRSWSTSSKISVDYEAVQAAIDAAQAAAGSLEGIATITASSGTAPPSMGSTSSIEAQADSATPKQRRVTSRRKLPITRRGVNRDLASSPPCSDDDDDDDDDDDRPASAKGRRKGRTAARCKVPTRAARASASYKMAPPLKKRARRQSPEIVQSNALASVQTPKVSNRAIREDIDDAPEAPFIGSSEEVSGRNSQGTSNKKWESMFDALVEYREERRAEDTKNMSEEAKLQWTWDGNVPTNYKTKDGKALGRWINNQRSAKGKGNLKEEREERLVAAGLKWSVLNSNSWNEMLKELQVYIDEVTTQGKKWDGNVPTNYQIKSRPGSIFQGEDRNLGRWVGRQRTAFQSGRLPKERQLELEKIGLKWSILTTLSWDSMFESLVAYVEVQKANSGEWDGNVPATYRTNDDPPRSLGRWINRMRSSFVKNRLKDEYKDKLSALGLKWSVHFRGGTDQNEGRGDDDPGYNSDGSREKGPSSSACV